MGSLFFILGCVELSRDERSSEMVAGGEHGGGGGASNSHGGAVAAESRGTRYGTRLGGGLTHTHRAQNIKYVSPTQNLIGTKQNPHHHFSAAPHLTNLALE